MRGIFGIVSLLVVLAIVGVLARKQMGASTPTVTSAPGAPAVSAPGATPQQQVQDVKKAVEATLQAPRPMPEDSKP